LGFPNETEYLQIRC
jgi:hypothetical protein